MSKVIAIENQKGDVEKNDDVSQFKSISCPEQKEYCL